MSKPHLVLVPGAWHAPECFDIITQKLRDIGYTVHWCRMPAVGNDNPPTDLSQDVAALRSLVMEAIGSGNDVVVVPHSWSGIVAGSALLGLGKKQREEKGEKGGVIRNAYISCFVTEEGVSLWDVAQQQLPHWYTVEGPYSIVTDPEALYNGLPASDVAYHASKLQKHAFATQQAKATGAAWKEIPSSYLLCEDDQAIPAFAQEMMTNAVKDAGGDIEVTRVKTGHSPFLTMPDVVVQWLRKAAGETA